MAAEKGDRSRLEPVARQMFVDGQSLVAIEETLGVSRQSLAKWKEWGSWDKAKAAKDNYEAQLVAVRDQIMERVTEAPLQAGSYLDSLSKIEAILEKRSRNAREAADAIVRQKGEMFLTVVKDLIEYSRVAAPDLCSALQESFDDLMQYGREKYAA
jgi:hypothetical protein